MSPLALRLLSHLRRHEFLRPGERIGVAVSGGLDSVALLRLLLEFRSEFGIVVSVVHFNHKLRGAEADADEAFVRILAAEHKLEFVTQSEDVGRLASEKHLNIEAAARQARYDFFATLLTAPASATLHKIATAHTLDDQAETVLLRIVRGTGLRGLSSIHPRLMIEPDEDNETEDMRAGEIIRPLLATRRRDLKQYLESIRQPWREDSSNFDHHFTRNRLRQRVIPLLEQEFNPNLAESLAELAELARAEQDYWDSETDGWMGTVVQWAEPAWAANQASQLVQISSPQDQASASSPPAETAVTATVSRPWLLSEPLAVQRRLIKSIGEHAGIPLEFKHVEEILHFTAAAAPTRKELSLPLGWKVVREAESIVFEPASPGDLAESADYEYLLTIPGAVRFPSLGIVIEAAMIEDASNCVPRPACLLRPEVADSQLILRNWRPGDRYWPAHTKAPHKIKELLQERHVPLPERKLWPVLARRNEIIWLRGFDLPASVKAQPSGPAILIRESPVDDEHEL